MKRNTEHTEKVQLVLVISLVMLLTILSIPKRNIEENYRARRCRDLNVSTEYFPPACMLNVGKEVNLINYRSGERLDNQNAPESKHARHYFMNLIVVWCWISILLLVILLVRQKD